MRKQREQKQTKLRPQSPSAQCRGPQTDGGDRSRK
jgi:hypothetical protein